MYQARGTKFLKPIGLAYIGVNMRDYKNMDLSVVFRNYARTNRIGYTGFNFLKWYGGRDSIWYRNTEDVQDSTVVIPEDRISNKKLLKEIYTEMDRCGIYRKVKNGKKVGSKEDAAMYQIVFTGLEVFSALYEFSISDKHRGSKEERENSDNISRENTRQSLSKLGPRDANLIKVKEVFESRWGKGER